MEENKTVNHQKEEPEKFGMKDIAAMIIAQFMIIGPIALAILAGFWLFMLYVSKIWFRG